MSIPLVIQHLVSVRCHILSISFKQKMQTVSLSVGNKKHLYHVCSRKHQWTPLLRTYLMFLQIVSYVWKVCRIAYILMNIFLMFCPWNIYYKAAFDVFICTANNCKDLKCPTGTTFTLRLAYINVYSLHLSNYAENSDITSAIWKYLFK